MNPLDRSGTPPGVSRAFLACALLAVLWPLPARAQDVSVEGSVGAAWTDNVFRMRTPEWDAWVLPSLKAGVDFATFWTLQYEGSAEIYTNHTDLTSHDHALRLLANPAFGTDDRDEFLVGLQVETLRNLDAYADLNFLGGQIDAAVSLEPATWFAWQAGANVRYRRFYDDPQSDTLDVLASTEARFTLQSRTTISPRIGYGFRYNPGLKGQGEGRPDRDDHQLDAGLHFSQGLWKDAGLQADYSYRHLFTTSQALARKLTQTQFTFLTADFLAGGHRAFLKWKQVLPRGWSLLAGLEFRALRYPGWPVTDAAGNVIGGDREDRRLTPSATLGYSHRFGALGLDARVSYSYLRQWSNSADYDTQAHQVGLAIGLEY